MKRFAFFIEFFLLFSGFVFSQTKIAYSGDSGYTLVERTNLRRYVNGKYSGLTSREVRSFISRSFAPEGVRSLRSDRWYDGNFFVIEETLRNSKATMAGIHEAIPSVFKISVDGKMTMFQDNGYPTFRSFPTYTTLQLKPGDTWKGEGERAVDPMNKGIFTRMPVLALYTFEGEEEYKGERVFRIKAIWQTNYGFSNFNFDPKGDSTLKKGTGGHKADIIVRAATGEAILIVDNVDETFAYADGSQVNFKGTITMFTEYPPAVDHDKLIFALNRIAKADTGANSKAVKADKKAVGSSGAGEKIASVKGTGTDDRDSLALGGNSQKGGNPTEADAASVSGAGTGFGSISSKKEKAESSKSGEKIASAKDNGSGSSSGSLSDSGNGGLSDKKSGSNSVKSRLDEKFASAKGASGSQGNGADGNGRGIDGSASDSSSAGTDKNNMVYEETPAGIRLSVRDIKFKPDSDQVLPGEKSRLDEIAEVLKLAPNSQFLIEGHTASVGKPAGEQKLSEERAKNIATELAKRGIPADRFICKGHGGNKPIASNSTDSGRAQNRRVEITILE